jgi:hypothetical protein
MVPFLAAAMARQRHFVHSSATKPTPFEGYAAFTLVQVAA